MSERKEDVSLYIEEQIKKNYHPSVIERYGFKKICSLIERTHEEFPDIPIWKIWVALGDLLDSKNIDKIKVQKLAKLAITY